MDRKYETEGVDPKVPSQAIATIVVFVAAKFGLDVDEITAGAIAVVLGFFAGYFSPAPRTVLKERRSTPRVRDEAGYGLVEAGIFLLLLAIAVVIVMKVL